MRSFIRLCLALAILSASIMSWAGNGRPERGRAADSASAASVQSSKPEKANRADSQKARGPADRGPICRAWIACYEAENCVSRGFPQWLDRQNWFVDLLVVLPLLIFPIGPFAVFFYSEVHKGKAYRQKFLIAAGATAVAGFLSALPEVCQPSGSFGEWWAAIIFGSLIVGVVCAVIFCRSFQISQARRIYVSTMFAFGLYFGYCAGQLIGEFVLFVIGIAMLAGMCGAAAHHVAHAPSPPDPNPDRYEPKARTLEDGTHIEQDYAGSDTWHNRDYSAERYGQVGENEFKQKP